MTCNDCQERFSELYDGTLDRGAWTDVEAHLSSCEACRKEYDLFRTGLHALTTTASIEAPERFVESVSTSLRIEKLSVPPEPAARPRPPVRLPRWVPLAAAAGLVGVLVAGFLVVLAGMRDEVARMSDELKTLHERRPKDDPEKVRDNIVRVNGQEIPVDKFLAQQFEKEGLAYKEGVGWIPIEWKKHFDLGEVLLGGRWVNAQEEIEKRARELAAGTPAPGKGPTREKLIEEMGLVKHGKLYLPADWAKALDDGRILTAEGTWKTQQELVEQIMAENGLVRHAGRWMTEEQRGTLLARQRVRKGADCTLDPAVTRALDGLEIGPPMTWRDLTIFPLLASDVPEVRVSSLHEALAEADAEILDTAGILSVRLKNDIGEEILLLAGTFLTGGKCGRVVACDTVVAGSRTSEVRVYDAEPSAARTSEKFSRESGQHLATGALRRALADGAGQGAVWSALATQLSGIRKGTTAADVYRAHQEALDECRTALIELVRKHPQAVGAAVAFRNRLEYADVFATPALFQAHAERLLQAAALETVLRKDEAGAANASLDSAAVKEFLESAFPSSSTTVDDLVALRSAAGGILGRAVVRDDVALHVALFAEAGAPEPRAVPEIGAARLQKVLDDYEKRMDNGPASGRPAIIREISGLPLNQKRVTQMLLARLNDPDADVRRAAVEGFGRRGDADAVKALIAVIRETRRDLTAFAAAADALARLGPEEAVAPMLDALENKDNPYAAQVVAPRLPPLIQQQKRDRVVEAAISRMIDALESLTERIRALSHPQLEPEPALQGVLTEALRAATGTKFSDAADFRRWWNDPASRRKFLEERNK